ISVRSRFAETGGYSMDTRTRLASLLASSALASFAVPAYAADMPLKAAPIVQQPVSGYLEMEAGFSWMDNRVHWIDEGYSRHGTDNKWLVNGASRVNVWWGRNYSTQFDVWGGFDSFGRNAGD